VQTAFFRMVGILGNCSVAKEANQEVFKRQKLTFCRVVLPDPDHTRLWTVTTPAPRWVHARWEHPTWQEAPFCVAWDMKMCKLHGCARGCPRVCFAADTRYLG
jgi:hypothetical protein